MYACLWYIEHWKGKSRRLRPNLEDYIDGEKSVVLQLKGPKVREWWITHDVVNLVQHVLTEPLGGVGAEMGEVSCALPTSRKLFNWFAKRNKNSALLALVTRTPCSEANSGTSHVWMNGGDTLAAQVLCTS